MDSLNASQPEPSLRERVLTGAYWLAGLTFVGQIITWASTLIVIRLLRPEDYGLMAMASILIGFFLFLNEAGLGAAVIQRTNVIETEFRKAYGCVIIINLFFAVTTVAVAPVVALFFSEPRVEAILQVSSVNFVLQSLFFLPQSLLRRNIEFRYKSTIDLLGNLVSCAIVLIMAIAGYGVWSLVFGPIGMNIFKAVAFNLRADIRFWPLFSFKGMRHLLTFGAHVVVNQMIWYFYSQADIAIAGKLLGKSTLGIYSVAIYLVSLPIEKLSPIFNQVGFPAFSKIQNDLGAIQSVFLKIIRMLNLISFPTFVGLALVATDAIPLVLGPTWEGVVLPIQLLCFIMPLRFIGVFFAPIVIGYGRPDVITVNMICAIIFMPIAFYVGSKFGIIGLCYAWLTAFPLLFLFMLYRVFRTLKMPLVSIINCSLLALAATTVMAVGLTLFKYLMGAQLGAIARLTLMIPLGAVLYAGSAWLMDRNIWRELKGFFSS